MSLFIASIASGSNGNCYYIGNEREAVLVDAGISCREIEMRMKRLGLLLQNVKAIFISHEHSDHIRGLPALVNKFKIPTFITPATRRSSRLPIESSLVHPFTALVPVQIGDLQVNAFTKLHDAVDPHSFTVSDGQVTVGVFTDIGATCDGVIRHFNKCHAAFLEANYDSRMLSEGHYPHYLKNRIRGGQGHLSNSQALELFLQHKPSFMSHLVLAHLSKNNNCPKLVGDLFSKNAQGVTTFVASRNEESAVFKIDGNIAASNTLLAHHKLAPPQLELF